MGLGLRDELANAVAELGFTEPTEIQKTVIPQLTAEDKDLIALAQTGTGKTAAFGLPMLHRWDGQNGLTSLILTPTRELCLQVAQDLEAYAKYLKNYRVLAVYGGASIETQIKELKRGVNTVVATPGRLIDLLERRALFLDEVNTVVLDEADRMLDMGFMEDIENILSHTPDERNLWLFSATMPKEVKKIADRFTRNPINVRVGKDDGGAKKLRHQYVLVKHKDRYSALKRLIDFNPGIFGIVFTRTKNESQEIAEALIRDQYNADALHGDLTQAQREKVMGRFRQRSLQILVATDVAARGIDVDDVTHVFHYSLPDEPENYTHRSGRTARAGKSGIAIALVGPRDVSMLKAIEKATGTKFEGIDVPTGLEICHKQFMHYVDDVSKAAVLENELAPFMQEMMEKLEGISREDLIKKFASMEMNRFVDYYKNSPDLNMEAGAKEPRGEKMQHRGGFVRMFISLGQLDFYDNRGLFKWILDTSGADGGKVGKIVMSRSYSHVDIADTHVDFFLTAINGQKFNNREVRLEQAGTRDRDARGGAESGSTERGSRERGGRGGYSGGEGRSKGYSGGEGRSKGYGGGDKKAKSYGSSNDAPKRFESGSNSFSSSERGKKPGFKSSSREKPRERKKRY